MKPGFSAVRSSSAILVAARGFGGLSLGLRTPRAPRYHGRVREADTGEGCEGWRALRLLACAWLTSVGCTPAASAPEPPPVLVFAVDGFDWEVIEPLMAAGRMPTLERLAARGVSGELKTMRPSSSPRLWTTLATGRLPEEHGILDFTKDDPAGGKELFVVSSDRKVKAYWDILSERGVSSTTLGWWVTYPVDPVDGVMIAQTNTLGAGMQKGSLVAGRTGQVWPPDDEEWVLATLERQDAALEGLMLELMGERREGLTPKQTRRWKQCGWALRADSTYVAVLQELLARGRRTRVTALYFGGTDVIGHRFWAAHDPAAFGLDEASPEVSAFGHVLSAYYEYVDRAMGEVLALFPAETSVLVVSDHGMTGLELEQLGDPPDFDKHTGNHHGKLVHGAFIAAGHGIRRAQAGEPRGPGNYLGHITDFCPTLLALVDVPLGGRMAGKPLETVLDAAFLAAHPVGRVETYDDPAWVAARRSDVVDQSEERREQLENLGYLGDDED